MAKIRTRMGDGSSIELSESELKQDLEDGTKRPFDQKPKVMQRLHEKALANGLYIRVSDIGGGPGDRAAFCPPLVITTEEVDKMIGILQPIVASLHQTT